MFSTSVTAGLPATLQQYNRLREDARWAASLLCHESTTPNMTVVIEAGYFTSSAWANVVYIGWSQVIGAVGAQPRWDLLSINTSGTLVLTVGTASGSPVKPTLPAGNFPIGYVYLRVWGTSIKSEDDATNHYIQDARLFFSNPTDAETLTTLGTKLYSAAVKTTPVDADGFPIYDSAATNAVKTLTFTNLKVYIKAWYDAVASTLTNKSISYTTNIITGTKAEYNTSVTDGDIVFLDSVDTIAGVKTFLDTKFGLRNVANTFTWVFSNTITAARTWTLPDRTGTIADDTDLALKLSRSGWVMTGKTTVQWADTVGATYAPATGAQTVALDCLTNNMHIVTGHASGTAITFTVVNATNNQIFIVSVLQWAALSTISGWFATVRWAGGTVPTLTATVWKRDTFGFIRTGVNTYDGFIIWQNC